MANNSPDWTDVDADLAKQGMRRATDGESGWYVTVSDGRKIWATDAPPTQPAPVAPTGGDVKPGPRFLTDEAKLTGSTLFNHVARAATIDEMIAFLEDTNVDQAARIIGALVWLKANREQMLEDESFSKFVDEYTRPAPNVGETAAHLCSVIGCGKVATHVSDVPYRDGVKAHYCDEHSLYERPIDTAGAETVAPLVTTKGRVIRPGPNLVATFGPAAMLADALAKKLDRLDTTPAQPATARKLSSVKLTAAQIAVLEWLVFKDGRTINAVGQSYHNGIHWGFYFRYPTFRVLKDKGLIEPAEAEQLGKFTAYRISAAGVAALGARESEAK